MALNKGLLNVPTDQTRVSPSVVINGSRSTTIGSTGTDIYPNNLDVHYMIFRIKQYDRFPNITPNIAKKTIYSFALPIPNFDFKEFFNAAVDTDNLSVAGAAVVASSSIPSLSNLKSLSFYKKMLGSITDKQAGDAAGAAASLIAQQATSQGFGFGINAVTKAGTGTILNPNYTVLFHGIPLRKFNFQWRLAPDSPQESETLGKIIQNIKAYMLPDMKYKEAVLEYPCVFDITIEGCSSVNWQFQFKTAFCTDINIDRAPQNVPVFSAGTGAPSVINLQLQFSEIESFVRGDINPNATADVNIAGKFATLAEQKAAALRKKITKNYTANTEVQATKAVE